MNAITLIAIRMYVAGAPPTWMPGVIRVTLVRSRAHSGQRIPTGVTVMQSGQMGRPQFEHCTLVSRPGCLSQTAMGGLIYSVSFRRRLIDLDAQHGRGGRLPGSST